MLAEFRTDFSRIWSFEGQQLIPFILQNPSNFPKASSEI